VCFVRNTMPLWVVAALVGCGPTSLQPTTASVQAVVFGPYCATTECHAPPEPKEGLDFTSVASLKMTAFNVPPQVGNAAAIYPAIVTPGDPDRSFLIAKVTEPGVEQGAAMPPTDQQLTADTVAVLRQWITDLAP
jgi:hypothetical protein